MDSTHDFVKKLHAEQEKSNKSKQSKANSGHKLPGKQHSTNK